MMPRDSVSSAVSLAIQNFTYEHEDESEVELKDEEVSFIAFNRIMVTLLEATRMYLDAVVAL